MVGAGAPRGRPRAGQTAAGRYLDARAPVDLGPREARVAPLTRLAYVPTAALLARCSAIVGGGFDPGLRYGEDVDLIWRMIAAGWRVRDDPPAEVRHVEPERWAAGPAPPPPLRETAPPPAPPQPRPGPPPIRAA